MSKSKIEEETKLDVLFVLCGSRTFPIIEDCQSFEEAMQLLDSKFHKKGSSIMSRHKLRNQKQHENESIELFMSILRSLARKCPVKALTADQYREILICDAFVAGLQSNSIRQRLLESSEDSLENLYNLALTLELAIEDTKNLSQVPAQSPSIFAASKSACFWCGGTPHQKTKCPARNSQCRKCQKQEHWEAECQSLQTRQSIAA